MLSFAAPLGADTHVSKSFETNYLEMQKKLQDMKARGEKVSDDTEKQMNALLVQMNHEHAELKRELEKKNQMIAKKVAQGKSVSEDWLSRGKRAAQELGTGITRAWDALTKPQAEAPAEDNL